MDYRNEVTGELAPAHRIGTTEDGRALYLAVEGWEPVSNGGSNGEQAIECDADGNWIDGVLCECGAVTGYYCCAEAGVIVETMPLHLRDDHDAARNSGAYPHNGARRLRVSLECAELLVEGDAGWTSIVKAVQ